MIGYWLGEVIAIPASFIEELERYKAVKSDE
jgi:hypothetical protein